MRRLLIVSISAGFFVCVSPSVAALVQGSHPTKSHLKEYSKLYHEVAQKFGKRTPGRNIAKDGLSTGRQIFDKDISKSIVVLQRMLAPPPPPVITTTYSAPSDYSAPSTATTSAPTTPSYTSSGGYSDVPGVPSSFAACVAMRESTDGAGSSNIYGILGSGGQGSISEQKAAFSRMYAAHGTEPWSPYDGC